MTETLAAFSPEQEAPAPYTPHELAGLIIGSFRYSQGMPDIQTDILAYLTYNYGDRLTDDALSDSQGIILAAALKITANPKLHVEPKNFDHRTILREVETAKAWTDKLRKKPYQPDMLELADKIIQKDRWYVGGAFDRRPRSEQTATSPNSDPYMSFYVYHGLMAQPTGFEEYDAMFRDMVTSAETYGNGLIVELVDEITGRYAKHHPEQVDLLPAKYRWLAENT